jgi:hypothetical protein
MRALLRNQTGLWLVVLLLLVAGCRQAAAHSEAFQAIFKPDAGKTFRGVDLGMPLASVKALEDTVPKHDDQWGYVYQYGLGGKSRFFLEYVCRVPEQRVVNSIVVNVFLEEKADASDLFAEVERHLRDQYGVADGSLGHLTWRKEEANLMVALRMLDDKKSISLNYGALDPS